MEDTTTREGAAGRKPLALIAAGGEGKRLGAIGPKALVVCAGKPLLGWCLDAFASSANYGRGAGVVVVAAHVSDLPAFESACEPARALGLDVIVTEGGPSRSHSVASALRAGLESAQPDIVLVHDAARIFTTPELIDALCAGLRELPGEISGLIAARPATDTIKLVDDELVVHETPPRERLWAVQTPQAFRARALSEALGLTAAVADDELSGATDDASLIEARGGRVKVFEWKRPNGKITTPEDLAAAELALS
jgi:2-C-methyl-D-erythritol 4-phosphate cytidylyltransferase